MPRVPSTAVRRPNDRVSPAADAPAPDYWETVSASFRAAKDDISMVQDDRIMYAYDPIFQALREKSGEGAFKYRTISSSLNLLNPYAGVMEGYDRDLIWQDIQKYGIKTGYNSREEFEKAALTRNGERTSDLGLMSRHNGVSGFSAKLLGGLGAMPFDPVNLATLPLGGGAKTLTSAILLNAGINAGIETVQTPFLAAARTRMGETLTTNEVMLNISAAAAFGGLLGGAGHYVGKKIEAMTPLEKRLAKALEAENITVGTAIDDAIFAKVVGRLDNEGLADLAEVMIGLDSLTPTERGHIANIRREGQIDAMNPYIADGAGIAAHQDGLAAAMRRILDDAPPSPSRAVPFVPPAPVVRASVDAPNPRLRSSTGISSGNVAGDAFATVKSRIGVVESGGNNNAKNPKSSATGTYQFVTSTWVNLYVRRFGRQGMTDGQIAAQRSNSRLQEVLMDDLMQANASSLRSNGHAVDAGNLYLAHFAGTKGADKLLRADPNASALSFCAIAASSPNA